jgi:hypothetical protein
VIWTIAWAAWIAAFVILEAVALARQQLGDTLSERVWSWFRVRDARPTALTWIGRGVLLIAGVWLTGHLAFGWWTL